MLPETIAPAFLARHGERGLWLQVIEVAAGVMAAREHMANFGGGESALVDGLARLDLLLGMAALPGVGVCAQPWEEDVDAWAYPGLILARLVVAASWHLRGRHSAEGLCQTVADARSAVRRVSLPWGVAVDEARARIAGEL